MSIKAAALSKLELFATVVSAATLLVLFLVVFPATCAFADDEVIVVSLGDSYSSGEGIEPYYGQYDEYNWLLLDKRNDVNWLQSHLDWVAHRSTLSWPGRLVIPSDSSTSLSSGKDVSWYFVAKSGAETKHLSESFEQTVTYAAASYEIEFDPQLQVFSDLASEGKQADYVTMTIGGNDVGFTDVIHTAATSGWINLSELENKIEETWAKFRAENGIATDIRNAYTNVRKAAGEQAHIIVAGYPTLLDDDYNLLDNNGRCVLFTNAESRCINNAVSEFNNELDNIVTSLEDDKIHFVSVEEYFDGHEAYSYNEYLNQISLVGSEDVEWQKVISSSSIHPNKKGAVAYAAAVQEKIKEIEKDEAAKDIASANSTVYISSDASVAVLDKDGDALQNYHIEMTVHSGGKYSNYSFDVTEGSFSLDGYGLESLSRASVTITVPDQEGSCRLMMVVTSDGSDEVTIQTDFTSSSGSNASSTTGSSTFDDIPADATTYNGHSYYIFSQTCDTWEEAKLLCEDLGGHLAVINDEGENEFLYEYMITEGYDNAYFGYSDTTTEGIWEWVEGASSYANWGSDRPSQNTGRNYAMFDEGNVAYKWYDANFNGSSSSDKIFICEWDGVRSSSASTTSERDIVLVLDVSGSMAGDPLDETKEAAVEFVETVFDNDARVSLVTFDNSAELQSDFTQSETLLSREIDGLYTGGGTNMEAGLKMAASQLSSSNASKKIIVLMTDGEPNDGKTGDDLIAYADQIKDGGVTIYTLGFFQSLGTSKSPAQALLEGIASEGCHYEVDDASKLQYFFGDIADQISGQNYIYVRIACPVEVEVSYDGETLSSAGATSSQRTSFGTLTFEDAEESSSISSSEDDDADTVKILRLKEGVAYDISIDGTGSGEMDYSIGFVDDEGDYSDMRRFNDIEIASTTHIETTAEVGDETTMKIDEDGDGNFETVYRAGVNEEAELVDESWKVALAIVAVVAVFLAVGCLSLSIGLHRRKKRMARSPYGVR